MPSATSPDFGVINFRYTRPQPVELERVQAHNKLSVLIADDNPDIVSTLAAILADEGYVVNTCLSGTHALECIKQYEPDVCLLDIAMPGMTGFELASEVQRLTLSKRPRLIAISGEYTKETDRLLAQSVGFDHYLVKPADPSVLLRMLEEIGAQE